MARGYRTGQQSSRLVLNTDKSKLQNNTHSKILSFGQNNLYTNIHTHTHTEMTGGINTSCQQCVTSGRKTRIGKEVKKDFYLNFYMYKK